eukprot:755139_1
MEHRYKYKHCVVSGEQNIFIGPITLIPAKCDLPVHGNTESPKEQPIWHPQQTEYRHDDQRIDHQIDKVNIFAMYRIDPLKFESHWERIGDRLWGADEKRMLCSGAYERTATLRYANHA